MVAAHLGCFRGIVKAEIRCMIQSVILLILEVKLALNMSAIILDRSINTQNMFIRQVLGVLVRLTEQQAYS
jgi:hypothetical protein